MVFSTFNCLLPATSNQVNSEILWLLHAHLCPFFKCWYRRTSRSSVLFDTTVHPCAVQCRNTRYPLSCDVFQSEPIKMGFLGDSGISFLLFFAVLECLLEICQSPWRKISSCSKRQPSAANILKPCSRHWWRQNPPPLNLKGYFRLEVDLPRKSARDWVTNLCLPSLCSKRTSNANVLVVFFNCKSQKHYWCMLLLFAHFCLFVALSMVFGPNCLCERMFYSYS